MKTKLKQRKLNRKRGYDYTSAGYYFVTICAGDRYVDWFAQINSGETKINEYGTITEKCWNDLPNHYHNVILDAYVIMPNHFHGIIQLCDERFQTDDCRERFQTVPYSLSEIIRGFKTFSSRRINEISDRPFRWQKSYHDRIIRDADELSRIRAYIKNNPVNWDIDDLTTM